MKEDAAERSAQYVEKASQSLKRLKLRNSLATASSSNIEHVLELAREYVKDAKHYADEKKPVTSLACVSYAEGLLDAMKFLELVDF